MEKARILHRIGAPAPTSARPCESQAGAAARPPRLRNERFHKARGRFGARLRAVRQVLAVPRPDN